MFSARRLMMFNICVKFHENMSSGFKLMEQTRKMLTDIHTHTHTKKRRKLHTPVAYFVCRGIKIQYMPQSTLIKIVLFHFVRVMRDVVLNNSELKRDVVLSNSGTYIRQHFFLCSPIINYTRWNTLAGAVFSYRMVALKKKY